MRCIQSVLVFFLLMLLLPMPVYANSTPVIMEGDPGYVFIPEDTTPIAVSNEYLEFDMREGYGYTARVTASYEMVNTGTDVQQQVMLFPFVTAYYKGFADSVRITADGRELPFELLRLDDVSYLDKEMLMENDAFGPVFNRTVSIEGIIDRMNQPAYTPKNFSLDQMVTVRVLELPGKEEAYTAEAAFQIDYENHIILYDVFNGASISNDGSGVLSVWSLPEDHPNRDDRAYIAVLGETTDNPAVFSGTTGQDLVVLQMTLEDYLENYLLSKDLNYFETEPPAYAMLKEYAVKRMDLAVEQQGTLMPFTEYVIHPFTGESYMGVFLYSVEFPAEASINVTVSYEMEAARDRRDTNGYVSKFLYFLQPATRWKGFGELEIRVTPHENLPYLLESSLHLKWDGDFGAFIGNFDGLPENDLYFALYSTDQPDPPVRKAAALYGPFIRHSVFSTLLILTGILVLTVGIAVWFKKRQR